MVTAPPPPAGTPIFAALRFVPATLGDMSPPQTPTLAALSPRGDRSNPTDVLPSTLRRISWLRWIRMRLLGPSKGRQFA